MSPNPFYTVENFMDKKMDSEEIYYNNSKARLGVRRGMPKQQLNLKQRSKTDRFQNRGQFANFPAPFENLQNAESQPWLSSSEESSDSNMSSVSRDFPLRFGQSPCKFGSSSDGETPAENFSSFAGSKFNEPPSPKVIPKPPSQWVTDITRPTARGWGGELQRQPSSNCLEMTSYLKAVLNIQS